MNILKNDKDMLTPAFAGQHIFFTCILPELGKNRDVEWLITGCRHINFRIIRRLSVFF